MKKVLLSAFVIIAFSAISFGQSATATASGTVVPASGISHAGGTDMNFGSFIVSGAGLLTLNSAGSLTAQTNATPVSGSTTTAATFTLTGLANQAFTITLPTTNYIITKQSGSGETMTVNAFSSNLSGNAGTLDGSGQGSLSVGATLNFIGTQATGIYTNSTGFEVTVNY